MIETSARYSKRAPLGLGGWVSVAILLGVLGASIWFVFYGWNLTNAKISTAGMILLAMGVVVCILLGSGLMALAFWSHRKGYDR